jgi:transposase
MNHPEVPAMPRPLTLDLSPARAEELARLRDHHPKPYVREKAAALLKVAAGRSARWVAAEGLLRPYREETISAWVARYRRDGVAGLVVRPGRGREPAFSP